MRVSRHAIEKHLSKGSPAHRAICILVTALLCFWAVPASALEEAGAANTGDGTSESVLLSSANADTVTDQGSSPGSTLVSTLKGAGGENGEPADGPSTDAASGQSFLNRVGDSILNRLAQVRGAYDDRLTVTCVNLDALYDADAGMILYDLITDTTQTITLSFGEELFSDEWLEVKVNLPRYGFQFTDNLLNDLNDQSQIQNARFIKDAHGYNTALTFELFGNSGTHHHVDVQTKYAVLANDQCDEAIEYGWQDSTMKVEVSKKSDGTELATVDSPAIRPREGTVDDVMSVATHEWNTPATKYSYGGGQTLGAGSNNNWLDKIQVTMRVVGGEDDTALIRLDEFRVYVPENDKRIELQDYVWTSIVYYGIRDHTLHDYFTCDYQKRTDDDGLDYYLFTAKPGKAVYNRGTDAKTETITMDGALLWKMADFDENGDEVLYLNSNDSVTTYAARDMDITWSTTDGNGARHTLGPGTVFRTPEVRYHNAYGFAKNNTTIKRGYDYYQKKYDATLGRYTSPTKVVAGSTYTNQPLMILYNDSRISGMIDYRGPDGDVTEVYEFPFEVRPQTIHWAHVEYAGYRKIDRVSYTVEDENGVKTTIEAPLPESGNFDGTTVNLAENVPEGSRVTRLEVHWARLYNSVMWGSNGLTQGNYTSFSYAITETHENGDPIEDGELLRIGYTGTFNEPGYEKSFAEVVAGGAENYLYLEVEAKKCPWLMAYSSLGGLYSALVTDYESAVDIPLASAFYLKGMAGGSYRSYMEDPRIEFGITATKDGGFTGGEWIAFLSPCMTLNKNLSGWHIEYSVHDEATGTDRSDVYDIGEIDGDLQLDDASFHMKETEYFTSFALYKEGRADFESTRTDTQKTPHTSRPDYADNSPAGTYDVADLITNVKARPRTTGADGSRLIGPNTIELTATITHGGTCDRADHTNGNGERNRIKTPNSSGTDGSVLKRLFVSDYVFTVTGPNYSVVPEESTVHQGGTIVSDMVFKLKYKNSTYSEYATPNTRVFPYKGVAERLYIELTDPLVDVDLTNGVFRKSLADHGMTVDDVSVVTVAGKRWICLNMPTGSTVAWGPKLTTVHLGISTGNTRTMNFPFKIALRVWSGHELGSCSPFGEVYYDLADYATVFDGSEASGYRRVDLVGTESNEITAALTGDATRPLFRGDATSETFEVLRNYSTGATVDPGKHGVIHVDEAMGYRLEDRDSMFAAVTINAPESAITVYDYETVLQLPRSGESYSWNASGDAKSGTSDHTLLLSGAASISKSTLAAGSTVSFTYSIDGTDFVDPATAAADWSAYRFVKIHVSSIDPFKSLEVRFPVTTDDPVTATGKVAYLGGNWSYKASEGGDALPATTMAPAEYVMAPAAVYSAVKHLKAPGELSGDGTHEHSYPFAAGAYSFVLSPLGSAPMPGGATSMTAEASAATIETGGAQSGGRATFSAIEFDAPGTYKYQIREIIPADATNRAGVRYDAATDAQKAAGGFEKDGVVFDASAHDVTVSVTRASDGRLVATPSSGNSVEFTNRYEVEDELLTLVGSKELIRADGTAAEHVSGYSFKLEEKRGDNWTHVYDAAVDDDGSFRFTPLEFTQLDLDAGRAFEYRISEIIPSDAQHVGGKWVKEGVTYDQSAYRVLVNLVDNGDGTMEPQATYSKTRGVDGAELSGPEPVQSASGVVFSNTYECKAEVALGATKNLAGRDWNDEDAFSFLLEGLGELDGPTIDPSTAADMPLPAGAEDGKALAVATIGHKTTSFAPISFTHEHIGKTFAYRLTEPTPAVPAHNMAYSGVEYIAYVHVVRDKGAGEIETSVSYLRQEPGGEVAVHGTPSFLNKEYGHGVADIFVAKGLEGREWTPDDTFTFELTADHAEQTAEPGVPVEGVVVPMPDGASGSPLVATAVAQENAENAKFADIHFSLGDVGRTYYYKVRESVPEGAVQRPDGVWVKDGIAYSGAENDVRVVVQRLSDVHPGMSEDEDAITAHVEYRVRVSANTWEWTADEPVEFENHYSAAPVTSSDIQARKLLKAPADLNEAHDYDWAYAFEKGAYSFTLRPGANEAGEVSPMPLGEDGEPLASMTAETSEGLVNNEGKMVDGSGLATFGAIEFDKAGHYVYTVTETIPDDAEAEIGGVTWAYGAATAEGSGVSADDIATAVWRKDGITYTQATHNAYVEVTDNGMGNLVAEVSYWGEDGERTGTPHGFTNLYHVGDVNLTLSGSKTLNGVMPGAGYDFTLTRMEDEDSHRAVDTAIRWASSTEDGTFTFPEAVFPQWRLGKTTIYLVSEVVPDDAVNADGVAYAEAGDEQRAAGGFKKGLVTYDASVYQVSVAVRDAGGGEAWTDVSYQRLRNFDGSEVADGGEPVDAIGFQNEVDTAGTATLEVAKELKGRSWEEGDAFEFEAEPVSVEDIDPDSDGEVDVEAPLPAWNASATYEAHEGQLAFGEIWFHAEHANKVFTYKLSEKAGDAEGMTYDDTVYYAVVSTRDVGDGTLDVEVAYYKGSVDEANLLPEGEVPSFTNWQGLVPCKHDPPVRKVVEGSPDEAGAFTFEMRPTDASFPMMEGAVDGVKTVVQTGPGAVEFGTIEFTRPGTYEYTVRELAGEDSAYTYDDAEWTVRYVVTEQDMHLHAERVFLKDGEIVDALEATFTNVYEKAEPAPDPEPDPDPQPEPDPDPDPDPEPDPDPGSSTTSEDGKAKVVLEKSQDKSKVRQGDTITYTLKATNEGDAPADGLYVKDYVPEGTSFVSCGGDGAGAYGSTLEGREFATWWLASLDAGESASMTLTVRVNECRPGDSFKNVAAWESGDPERPSPSHDPDPGSGGGSNTVEAKVPENGGSSSSTQGGKTDTTSGRGATSPNTGDLNGLVPVAALVSMLAAAALAIAARRRME